MPGRAASAAMPKMGYTCLLCTGKPSVITGGEPGDEQALLNAAKEWAEHLRTVHGPFIAANRGVVVAGGVSARTQQGPTTPVQAAA